MLVSVLTTPVMLLTLSALSPMLLAILLIHLVAALTVLGDIWVSLAITLKTLVKLLKIQGVTSVDTALTAVLPATLKRLPTLSITVLVS